MSQNQPEHGRQASQSGFATEREELEREIRLLRSELTAATELLRTERAQFAAEVALGAKELDLKDQRVDRLIKRRNKLILERDRARRTADSYQSSRVVRFTARVVWRLRRLRGNG